MYYSNQCEGSLATITSEIMPADMNAVPLFAGYQLLGDSIFVRFAKTILNIPSTVIDGSATLGYCVSGQRINQLNKRIQSGCCKLSKKVIILIGTNDMLCGRSLQKMIQHFTNLTLLLRMRQVEEFVILTLPPIPKFSLSSDHWALVQGFNQFLRELGKKIPYACIIDIFPKFLKQDSPILAPAFHDQRLQSPKRKAETPTSHKFKKKRCLGQGLLADDNNLSQFGKYINKVNRREWEKEAVSSDDDGYCPNITPVIEYSFWRKLKETIIIEEEEFAPQPVILKTLGKNSPTSSPTTPHNTKSHLDEINKKIMKLANNFIRLDYYELYFYNQRIDMVHPNEKGLRFVENQLREGLNLPRYERKVKSL